jgi:16S rRNA (guanine1207-N2)-methyltransferase
VRVILQDYLIFIINNMSDHYYTQNPESLLKTKEFSYMGMKFTTSSGVFSNGKLDLGTKILIESCIPKKRTLDLGCGYGVVGITIKKKFPETIVTCSDINKRAITLAKANAKQNDVDIVVVQSDIFSDIETKFDTILVNLPQNAGKKICFKMIEQSFCHLIKGGTLQAVSRHQKGGKQYQKKMIEIFKNCDCLAKNSGYRIYISKK